MGRQRYFQVLEQYNQLAAVEAQAQTASTAALPVVDRAIGYIVTLLTDAALLFTGTTGAVGLTLAGSLAIIENVSQLPPVNVDVLDIVQGSAGVGGLVTSVWAVCRVLQPQRMYLLWSALLEDEIDEPEMDEPQRFNVLPEEMPERMPANDVAIDLWRDCLKLWRYTYQQRRHAIENGKEIDRPWSRRNAGKALGLSQVAWAKATDVWVRGGLIDNKDKSALENVDYKSARAWERGVELMVQGMPREYIKVTRRVGGNNITEWITRD